VFPAAVLFAVRTLLKTAHQLSLVKPVGDQQDDKTSENQGMKEQVTGHSRVIGRTAAANRPSLASLLLDSWLAGVPEGQKRQHYSNDDGWPVWKSRQLPTSDVQLLG
jgi:hypothetical protein